jgi:transposase
VERLEKEPAEGSNAMVSLLAGVIGVGVETADLLVQEVLSRNLHGWKREREKAIFCRGGCGLDAIV